eukprot:COSAG01_NODE_486_length_16379_cov_28.208717_4_plen_63_part_00
MLHAAAAAGGPGMMPARSIAAACQYSCTRFNSSAATAAGLTTRESTLAQSRSTSNEFRDALM